ncbi:Stk1 family PASTA domain-containing Ser/Thr kinase [Lentibacillus sediminis]|uniref:Stk1 family PASTA domain-containing Ser/Thr kinase n=1 Tax=Lentibacillus sediminis TaxID=1940529 RepID=UPI000C1C176B|nr:Stk1 family PASTA domain-containing Ser/Thr kinase [Lentibacillus sediminis]
MLNGHLLNDRYQLNKTIGGGGMADVYLAWDTILNREVAIKVLRMEYANDEEFLARFDREAHSAISLAHPSIVNIYDVGEEDNISYIVMEYVEGMTLKEYIQQHGPLDVQEALDILKQIAAAIAHAHANDIVHRDIKPQNILIDSYGEVKVTDFGIAIALSATSLTQTNSILGSVHYLSPEQARGGTATKKSDIYSIGIVLFELLTGRLPFSGQSPISIALKHLQNETPSVRKYNPGIPQSVENIVLKATAKDPFHRYDNVYDISDTLEGALDPDRQNEAVYTPPVEAGDETKAIPVITDDRLVTNNDQETVVHQGDAATKNFSAKGETSAPPADGKKEKKKKKKKKPKQKRKKKWLIGLAVFVLLLAATVTALFAYPGFLLPQDVTIPDVTELEADDAQAQLEGLNLLVEQESVFSNELEEGQVTRTSPQAGDTVKEESQVTLYVSQGPETVAFDDYVGRDFSQVDRLLAGQGYEVIQYEQYSDRPAGEIITQIQPEPDSEVVPSETRVIFEVSMGPEPVTLSNLVGMTEQEARTYLENNNLTMNVTQESSDTVPAGEIIRQDPAANAEIEDGSAVQVYISTGPEELPPASHTITYTVPYEPPESEENNGGEGSGGESEEGSEEGSEEESAEPVEQTVRLYIGDMNNDISEVFQEETITEDTEFTFTLTIPSNETAEYLIMRDDEELTSQTVSYEEGE